jgi:hypothetical protein
MERQRESLQEETRTAIDEARMVLPGIQALFGFQLIAVFSDRFEKLPAVSRCLHLVSIGFIVLAIVFVMAPAAFHRIGERGWVSRALVDITSNFLTLGMTMLMLGLSLEFALIGYMILDDAIAGAALGGVLFVVLLTCWIFLPWRRRGRK